MGNKEERREEEEKGEEKEGGEKAVIRGTDGFIVASVTSDSGRDKNAILNTITRTRFLVTRELKSQRNIYISVFCHLLKIRNTGITRVIKH